MFNRGLIAALSLSFFGGFAGAQERGAVAPIISGPNAKLCFEASVNAGADVCLQRTAPGVLNLTPGIGTGTAIGGSSTSPGPIINVANPAISGCFATVSTGQDWSTCFASITTATVAAAKVSTGIPTQRTPVVAQMPTSTGTVLTATVNISAGDTVLVGIVFSGASTQTFTVTDVGGNAYAVNNMVTAGPGSTNEIIFSTAAGAAKAASGLITVTCTSGATFFGFIVGDWFNVGSFGQRNILSIGTSVTPSNAGVAATSTQDNNNIVASFLGYCGGGATTLVAATGTLQASWNGTAVICGSGLVTNTSATPSAGLTTSATISASTTWAMSTIELRSVSISKPTIYFPVGTYVYTSGIAPTVPVTLKGEKGGSVLCYQGVAHAIDLGPSGLTSANFQGSEYYTIDGLGFQCGGSMTEGIFVNNWLLFAEVKNSSFLNFGNPGAAGIWANGNQNDLYLNNNSYIINDGVSTGFPGTTGVVRQWVNISTNSAATTLRMENNSSTCYSGTFGFVGCGGTFGTTPALIAIKGITHLITGNNFQGGFCPFIALLNGDVNSHIELNHFESDAAGCYAISYQTNAIGMRVINNNFTSATTGTSLLGPADGSQLLVNAEVEQNHVVNLPAATPLVTQNNLAAQTGNLAWHNMCAVAFTAASAPCPLLHTAGGSINQWNGDYSGSCTLTTGACPVFSFQGTYAAAPKCTASWTGTGTFTGILKVATSTTQLTITDTVSESTGVINWSCNPDAQ